MSADRLQQIQHAILEDPVLPLLSDVIKAGWPNDKRSVPPAVLPYWDARDELVIDGSLIFKGHRLVIPVCLRAELLAVTHASHIGIEGCLRHARECLLEHPSFLHSWTGVIPHLKDQMSVLLRD